jgi:catechol 2,3-dioxygenase-like lactoylglutathione lyase family enzyme
LNEVLVHNVTFDCHDPDRLADFWSSVLDYQIEGSGEGWAAIVHPTGKPPATPYPRLLFLRVPEPKQAKNRVHLDVDVPEARFDETLGAIIGLGAVRMGDFDEEGEEWTVLADPEGNEFCLAPRS